MLLLCIFFLLTHQVCANVLYVRPPAIVNSTEELYEKIKEVDKSIRDGVESLLKYVLPILIRANSELDLSPDCSDGMLKLVMALRDYKTWAFRMVDASGKLPSGLLSGTTTEFGAYDQCLDIKVPNEDDYSPEEFLFRGQYCTVEFRPYLPPKPPAYKIRERLKVYDNFTTDVEIHQELLNMAHLGYFTGFRFGVCLPSVCTRRDVTQMVSLAKIGFAISVPRCEVREELSLSTLQIVLLAVFSLLGLLVIAGTSAEIIPKLFFQGGNEKFKKGQTSIARAISAFSVYSNVRNLLKIEENKLLKSLHGIKFLSLTWIIVGHGYMFWNMEHTRMVYSIALVEIESFAFQAVVNALLAIDTFFFITGLLLCYITLTTIDKHGKEAFSVPVFFIHRFWRLFPSTAAVIGLTFLLPLIGSGPSWHDTIDIVVDNCQKNWWTNLIFVNNFLHPNQMCLVHTWYTAADLQMFLLAIVYFLLVFKKAHFGFLYLAFLAIFSIVSLAVINMWFDLLPTFLPSFPDPEQQMELISYLHVKPNCHLAPYAMGLGLGYILVRHPDFKIHRILQLVGWILAITCNMTVLYSTYVWNGSEYPTMAESALFASLRGTGWALGLAWMIFMCATNRGGIINSILSWNAFVPLSRLTFIAYLVHLFVLWVFIGNLKGTIDASQLFATWIIIGNIFMAYAVAFVAYLLFEAPMARLYKTFMSETLKKKIQEDKYRQAREMWHTKKAKNGRTPKAMLDPETAVYHL